MSYVTYNPPYYSTTTSSTTLTTGLFTASAIYVPASPVRRKTELDWLDEQVDKVCALAR
jgi:hypothetical protein